MACRPHALAAGSRLAPASLCSHLATSVCEADARRGGRPYARAARRGGAPNSTVDTGRTQPARHPARARRWRERVHSREHRTTGSSCGSQGAQLQARGRPANAAAGRGGTSRLTRRRPAWPPRSARSLSQCCTCTACGTALVPPGSACRPWAQQPACRACPQLPWSRRSPPPLPDRPWPLSRSTLRRFQPLAPRRQAGYLATRARELRNRLDAAGAVRACAAVRLSV